MPRLLASAHVQSQFIDANISTDLIKAAKLSPKKTVLQTQTNNEASRLLDALRNEVSLRPELKNDYALKPQLFRSIRSFDLSPYIKLQPNLSDPAAMDKHAASVEKKRATGSLYVRGVTADDVKQGSIADCYLACALSTLADTDPNAIKNAITDNGNGTYTVRFYENGKPVNITVDNELYHDKNSGSVKYGKSTDEGELWVSIMEKAYAKWKGGYEQIGNGGSVGAVLTAITGKDTDYYSNNSRSADQLFTLLDNATANNKPVGASTYSKGNTKTDKKYEENGLAAWHCYTVLDAVVENGQKYVILRNPWAYGEYQNGGYNTDVDADGNGSLDGNDGTFKMKIEDFQKLFQGVTIGD